MRTPLWEEAAREGELGAEGSPRRRCLGWPCAEGSPRLQGCGGEAPGSLRQPHPSDHIHVSREWGSLGADWRSSSLGENLRSHNSP